MNIVIYLVVAYKNGNQSQHSYTVAAYAKKHAAIKKADEYRDLRGGKYACVVEEIELGGERDAKEIYRACSNYERDVNK